MHDYIGGSYEYPDGDYATRARIGQAHVEYIQGFLYFLATDARPTLPSRLYGITRYQLVFDAGLGSRKPLSRSVTQRLQRVLELAVLEVS